MHLKTLIFAAGFALGIIVGFESIYASELAVAVIAIFLVQVSVWFIQRKLGKGEVALYTCVLSCAIAIGVVRVQIMEEQSVYLCESACTFEGEIRGSPEIKDTYQLLTVHPPLSDTYDVQIRVPLYPVYATGDTLQFSGKVAEPAFIYPHGNAQPFDYVSYLHAHNIGSEMIFPKVEILDTEPHTFSAFLGRWKEDMVKRVNRFVSSPASSLANGMLFGDVSMSKEMKDTFRVAGLSHIVVLSGFNIAVVITFVLFVFAFLPLVVRIGLATACVISFVLMVGGETSVIRATVMAFIGLLATLIGREYVAKQALIVSFIAIILYDPFSLTHDVSLHLSFLATGGLIYLSDPIKLIATKYLSSKTLVELVTTTFAAYLATLPYVMYTFGAISAYGLVANIVAVPLVPFAMLLSFLTVLASYVSDTLALFIGYADTAISNSIIFIATHVEALPFSQVRLTVSVGVMCTMYLLISILLVRLRKRNETFQTTKEGYITAVISY